MKLRDLIDRLEHLSHNGMKDNLEVLVGKDYDDNLDHIEGVYLDTVHESNIKETDFVFINI